MEISTLQRIVIVDNDSETLDWLQRHLEAPSLEISTTQSAEEAIDLFRSNDADLLIAEFNCTPFDGLTLLKKVRLAKPNAMVILNGLATSTNAVIEAMRLG
ncbi:MAG: response regulator, partial [Verrucomicrobiota bacterium]